MSHDFSTLNRPLYQRGDKVAREIYGERPGFMPVAAISLGYITAVEDVIRELEHQAAERNMDHYVLADVVKLIADPSQWETK